MRLRHLAMELSKLPPHPQHNVELEQYATEGDFAARWIAEMIERGDLDASTRVVDLVLEMESSASGAIWSLRFDTVG